MDVLDPVFPLQVRAARALLGWSQKDLAERAGVSVPFINRLESGDRLGHATKLFALQSALLQADIDCFSMETEFGVSLRGAGAAEARAEWRGHREKRGR